ncbi:VanZ like family-domain-containing protein [Lipomyces mesembrius]
MRIRKSFAAAFVLLLLLSAYLGFAPIDLQHDKLVHFLAFFTLTTLFYWIVDTTRRRLINATIIVCIVLGGIGSEFVQSFVPYRAFDIFDIVANVIGASLALALSSLYHKRMLERKRAQKYFAVQPQDPALELGETAESVDLTDLGTSAAAEPEEPRS